MSSLYKRYLSIDLPEKQSAFLWGARKTGKSTFLRESFPDSVYYDLLKTDLYFQLNKSPHLLREEILAIPAKDLQHPIIVDEIQLIPPLMNEVHWLIENAGAQFILCGSSARKMKQTGVNLLGGRAWRYNFYPLTYQEIGTLDLLKVLNHGMIPSHYDAVQSRRSLKAYVEDYLTQEIKSEGLVRNLPAFARFLDTIALTNSEMVNYSNVARDCGVDSKTVKEYYQILVDTLLGYFIAPFAKTSRKDIIQSMPKFYLFDVGVAAALAKETVTELKGAAAGKLLEQYIAQELIAYRGLNDCDFNIHYWRTKTGLEVDFVLADGNVAVEVKISDKIRKQDLNGLLAFAKEQPGCKCYIIANIPKTRTIKEGDIEISALPYEPFLKKLWQGEIV